jgi:hypothetical protein
MRKKPAKHKSHGERRTAAEVEATREAATLRRLRNQQRRITDLSRALRRAVLLADVARLRTARELCADTGWGVFDVDHIAARERQLEDAIAKTVSLEATVRNLEQAITRQTV